MSWSRPPFRLNEVVVNAQNQLRMSEDIVLFNMLGCVKKSWREEKSLLALRKKTLLGDTLSRGNRGARREANAYRSNS